MITPDLTRSVLLAGLALSVACESPVTTEVLRVEGRVELFNELGHELPADTGVSITLLGTAGAILDRTTTDAAGQFAIDLPHDSEFTLRFQRHGFGSTYRFGLGPDSGPIEAKLFARSSAGIVSALASAVPCGTFPCLRLALEVDDFVIAGSGRRWFRIFLSRDPAVGTENYEVTHLLVVPIDQPGLLLDGNRASFEVDGHGIIHTFPSGSRVHLLVHGATENLVNSFVDPTTGVEVFTDLSTTWARTSFDMP